MPFIYIDRRKAGKGKSTPNRQKLIRRVRGFVKSSTPTNIGSAASGGVGGANNNVANNPVKVAGTALKEPWLAYASGGDNTMVFVGNNGYDRGDEIDMPSEDDSSGSGGAGGSGEDDFVVNVAANEFFNEFFEDCELPNLSNERVSEKLDTKMQPAGFSTTGTPSQLSIIRTYKQMVGRRAALTGPLKAELAELQREQEQLMLQLADLEVKLHATNDTALMQSIDDANSRLEEIELRISALHRKIGVLSGFDKVDLRYKKKDQKPLITVDAVLFLLMDISGSMDEGKKRIARRWFALLFAFISKRYPGTQLRFIAHTDEVMEMSESEFFSTRVNGGTLVSPVLQAVNNIIRSDYDPTQTNIYISHASDGDNWAEDSPSVIDEMIGSGHLMSKTQYFNYVEVGGSYWHSISKDTPLWDSYEQVQTSVGTTKMSMVNVKNSEDCYSVFKKLFKKS